MAIDWGGDGIFGTIGKGIREYYGDSNNFSAIKQQAVAFVRAYIQYNSAIVLETAERTFADVLEYLIAQMVADGQTVNGNTVTSGGYSFIGSATPVVSGGFTATQMMVDDDVIFVECIAASAGADTWRLTSMRKGTISRRATTGVAYPSADRLDEAGISFTISSPSAGAYAVGDYFKVGPSTSDESGVIQRFFRDAIGRALPSVTNGSETISDLLATDNSNPSS